MKGLVIEGPQGIRHELIFVSAVVQFPTLGFCE
jgi:hypothetical protein